MSSEVTPIARAGEITSFDIAGGVLLLIVLALALTVAALALTH